MPHVEMALLPVAGYPCMLTVQSMVRAPGAQAVMQLAASVLGAHGACVHPGSVRLLPLTSGSGSAALLVFSDALEAESNPMAAKIVAKFHDGRSRIEVRGPAFLVGYDPAEPDAKPSKGYMDAPETALCGGQARGRVVGHLPPAFARAAMDARDGVMVVNIASGAGPTGPSPPPATPAFRLFCADRKPTAAPAAAVAAPAEGGPAVKMTNADHLRQASARTKALQAEWTAMAPELRRPYELRHEALRRERDAAIAEEAAKYHPVPLLGDGDDESFNAFCEKRHEPADLIRELYAISKGRMWTARRPARASGSPVKSRSSDGRSHDAGPEGPAAAPKKASRPRPKGAAHAKAPAPVSPASSPSAASTGAGRSAVADPDRALFSPRAHAPSAGATSAAAPHPSFGGKGLFALPVRGSPEAVSAESDDEDDGDGSESEVSAEEIDEPPAPKRQAKAESPRKTSTTKRKAAGGGDDEREKKGKKRSRVRSPSPPPKSGKHKGRDKRAKEVKEAKDAKMRHASPKKSARPAKSTKAAKASKSRHADKKRRVERSRFVDDEAVESDRDDDDDDDDGSMDGFIVSDADESDASSSSSGSSTSGDSSGDSGESSSDDSGSESD